MGKKNKRHHKSETRQEEDKPLKLVLKVATPDTQDVAPAEQIEEGERKHRHKKKKKKHSADKHKHHHEHHSDRKEKRKRESDVAGETGKSSVDVGEGPAKKRVAVEESPPTRAVATEVKSESNRVRLHAALCYLQKVLQRKDSNGFFVYPVTDNIAPGYSDIIEQPMDFSTMKKKTDNNEYTCIADYRRDFKLMCDNCMTYNQPDTIFYKEAKRLLTSGLKITTKEKLKHHTMPAIINLMPEDFGLEEFSLVDIEQLDEENAKSGNAKTSVAQSGTTMSSGSGGEVAGEAVTDDTSPEELLVEVEEAANEAADNLVDKNPKGKMGYLQRLENGLTVLNFLNPDNDGIVEEDKRVVTLGVLTGKLQSGSGSIAGFKEDKRNRATPVHYLTYGPFSSYGPIYDSSAANLSKEDSDLLLSTYGDETGVQYAKSLRSFVADADNYAIKMVDNLLDVLTHNEHSKTLKHLQSSEQQTEQTEQTATTEKTPSKSAIDFDSLRSLSSLGIDMSFLDAFEKPAKTDSIQSQLDTMSRLLSTLQTTQQERLGEKTPQHLAFVSGLSEKEMKLANEVKKGIALLTKQVAPGNIVDVSTLKACVRESEGDAADKSTTAETTTTTTTTTPTTATPVTGDTTTEVTQAAV